MIIYNITFNVEDETKDEWMNWIKKEFVPAMTKSGLLKNPQLRELLIDEQQGTSYALQFEADSLNDLDIFKKEELFDLLSSVREKFGEKVVFFPTEMKIIFKQHEE